jgi:hypothetical protein
MDEAALIIHGVSDGTRTRGLLDHNQELYQLSYTHHACYSLHPPA